MRSIQGKKVVTGRCGCKIEMKPNAVSLRSDMPKRGCLGRAVLGKRWYSVGRRHQLLNWFVYICAALMVIIPPPMLGTVLSPSSHVG